MNRAKKPEGKQYSNRAVAAKTPNFTLDSVRVLDQKVKILMKVTVSLAVLAITLFVVISKGYSPTEKNWAFGMLGTILGWWLKL